VVDDGTEDSPQSLTKTKSLLASCRAEPTTSPVKWNQFKRKVDPILIGQWQERSAPFESGTDWLFDIRFAAEGPIKAWVDDVTATQIPGSAAPEVSEAVKETTHAL